MIHTTVATNPATCQMTAPVKTSTKSPLENQLQAALEHARRLTIMNGTNNVQVAIAWETVDELRSAQSRQRAAVRSAFTRYCMENPEAPECRIYED
ncbi:Calvin cycle protein CP12 [Oscillatoria sp. CS-180]|uniref:Calvin cycle protein CP12 n=1 Tax=Oscillatoria sp. CS-180 TaxID=3021720 RepID=UPI0023305054|nr:Calvin cycle protein CP12 [Oscillatoria sp. CS-180]MDB9529155.1 Calvin cycle protein CP12 [Oscillatoria sp. CS-180]